MLEAAHHALLFPGARLCCAEGEVHVWKSDLRRAAQYTGDFHALLSEDERQRAAAFTRAWQYNQFVIGRGMLREILGRYLGVHGHDLRFCYGLRGKPALVMDVGSAPLYFNVAHSGERLVLAVTRIGEIGADIERLRGDIDVESMARRICTPHERARWRTLPPSRRPQALLRYWTRKEAYLKATGQGLAQRLSELDVGAARPRGAACEGRHDWSLHDLEAGGDYVAAIAVAGAVPSMLQGTWRGELARRAELV